MIHGFEGKRPRLHESAFVAWNAEVSGDAELAEGSSVWYGAVIRADIGPVRLGRLSNLQDGAVIHVDEGSPCVLGEGVTVGHRAVLHSCSVGDYALVGMGAIVLDGAEIGSESIVGAGALVTQGKKFPPRSMILGSPAKVVRELKAEEVESLHHHAEEYARLAKRTREGSEELR
ncbi:MAG TPA: gamma carbonic anhydrase family protein [Spirochaetia bacterium]|nr:gamma carbonic anhydrase family protein [Spirochaetales bacterium]HRY73392.1 gamma carbonic anhydrase family protein [Spirochaetia bacterium]